MKDISNLFVDTGLTSDAYSVIELNMIEQILSDKDDSAGYNAQTREILDALIEETVE